MPHINQHPAPEPSAAPAELHPQPLLHPMEGQGGRTCYVGWSPKLERNVYFGSRLEFFHWLLIEGTPEVLHFCEYFPSVPLESREFVFDMWLRWRDGAQECRTVVTSSTYLGVDAPGLRFPDWTVLVCWARDQDYRCQLITERELAASMKFINNWRRMLPFVRYARDNLGKGIERVVLERVRQAGELPMRDLLPMCEVPGDTQLTAAVADLLHAGKIRANLHENHFGPNLLLMPAA